LPYIFGNETSLLLHGGKRVELNGEKRILRRMLYIQNVEEFHSKSNFILNLTLLRKLYKRNSIALPKVFIMTVNKELTFLHPKIFIFFYGIGIT
jgi:hypothetical protein